MELKKVYSGKTKDIYKKSDGNLIIYFKDDVTGENGVVDPGANSVMGKIQGKGKKSLEITNYFFNLLKKENIPTHLISVDIDKNTMEVKEAVMPGKQAGSSGTFEFICRRKAYGSFVKRYQNFIKEQLQNLDYLVEITLKDDERGDPLINDDAIVNLGILTREQLNKAKSLTRQITETITEVLRKKNLCLVDIKMEFGIIDGDIALIDEISGDSMRVLDKNGKFLSHEDLYQYIFNPL